MFISTLPDPLPMGQFSLTHDPFITGTNASPSVVLWNHVTGPGQPQPLTRRTLSSRAIRLQRMLRKTCCIHQQGILTPRLLFKRYTTSDVPITWTEVPGPVIPHPLRGLFGLDWPSGRINLPTAPAHGPSEQTAHITSNCQPLVIYKLTFVPRAALSTSL